MQQTTIVNPFKANLADIGKITARLEKLLRAVGEARGRQRLTVEEAFIFLAVGHIGVSLSGSGLAIRPVTCIDVAAMLRIPRETVRRKAANLADINLVSMTTRGIMIENLDEWRRLVEAFCSDAMP